MALCLLVFCAYERRGSADAVLLFGIVASAFVAANAVVGFAAVLLWRRGERASGRALLFWHNMAALVAMALLVALAVATLLHWDVSGNPLQSHILSRESSSVQFGFLIWSLALAAALCMVRVWLAYRPSP